MVAPDAQPRALRIVYFGTPAFGVPTLEALHASRHEVVAVVTQPDRPRGRSRRVSDAPVKAAALARGLPVLQPDRLKEGDFLPTLARLAPDLGVVAAYGKILPQALLDIPRLGLLNVHASVLPAWRGAAPVHRAVMAGDTSTGVTIMRIVLALDAGPTLACRTRPIHPDETSLDVERDLAVLGADLLVTTVDDLSAGRTVETPQDDTQATYASRLTREDGIVDWSRHARVLHNQVRGLYPWPHAAAHLEGARLILHRTTIGEPADRGEPGEVLAANGDALVVAAGERTTLRLLEIQPEGKRVMSPREFLAGHRITAGVRFGMGQPGP